MADKIEPTYPKAAVNLNLKVDGVFGFPDEWKTTDEANPGMFTYTIKFCNMQITGGKIHGRQLTQKQLREQEQAKKKGGKKEAKKEENPAEAEKLKQMLQKQQAEERKREQTWSKMTEQQRFHSTCEDKYKSAILKFQNNSIEKQFNANLFVVLEERVVKDKGQWVYFFKTPTANQQDLDKLKKSKPKNLNIADLNPVCMRAWVNLQSLNSCEISQAQDLRCKVQQVDAVEETPKPNLQKCYIKISMKLSEPLLQKQDSYTVSSIIKDPPKPKQTPPEIRCVEQMREQLRLAIQSLAMQYSAMFWKDLNANEQQKSANIFVTNKKNEHSKRKEQFLYDFNVSGKYKVLKQRLKKIIVHLCESKFINKMQGAKSFTGITCSVRDQFYSEIYNFLVTSYTQTIHQLTEQKKQKLREVLVLNSTNQQKITQQHLQQYRKQNQTQRFDRIIKEYLLVGDFQYGQQMYKDAIAKNNNDLSLKYQYSMFCMGNGVNGVAEVLAWGYVQQYMETNKDNRSLQLDYAILMIGSEETKSLKKAWIILRELIQHDPSNIKLLLLAALTAQLLNKNETSERIKCKAFREQLRKQGKLKQQGKHHSQPLASQIPSLQSVATYKTQLKPEQKDNLWVEVMANFSQFGIYNIVQKIKGKLEVEDNPKMKQQKIKILYFQQQYAECRQKAISLYKEAKDFQLLQIIINCCHKLKEPEQKLKYLKLALTDAPQDKKGYALINLGFFYLTTNKYGNAKACLTKYLDATKEPGGLSWLMLGQSELMCNNYQVAVECFRHSNLCDPYNKEVWIWLAQAYAQLRNFVMVNQCLNCYFNLQSETKMLKSKLHQLKQVLQKPLDSPNFYQTSLKQKLIKKLEAY